MKGIPAIWFGLMLLALLTALTFWIDKVAEPPAAKRDGSTRHDPDYIVTNFSTLRTDGFGNPRYRLEGSEMRHFPDDDSTELTKPRFSMFALNKPTTEVIADRGKVSSNGENVVFMDNVKVVRAASRRKAEMTVLTDYLHIVPDKDLAQTDRPVIILQAPHTVVHATGMEFYKKQGIVNLHHHVKVHYERPGAPVGKALTIEQVAGSRSRLWPESVVQPRLDSLAPPPAVPAQLKNDVEKKTPTKQIQDKKVVPGTTVKAKGPGSTNKKSAKKSKAKKVTKTQAEQAQTEKSKPRIRRQYENP